MINRMGRFLLALSTVLFLCGCSEVYGTVETAPQGVSGESPAAEASSEQEKLPVIDVVTEQLPQEQDKDITEEYLQRMTIEEKVAQMFIILPEALIPEVSCVTAAGGATEKAINNIPVGGFVYLERNLKSPEQVRNMLKGVQKFSENRIGMPMFLCVDEEGGSVARIANSGNFDVEKAPNMAEVGARGDTEEAFRIGEKMGKYLKELGINTDFAPVADVLVNPENQVVRKRSFGSSTETVTAMTEAFAKGISRQHILSTYKHFPGHGGTKGDTHAGFAYSDRTLEQLYECELIPFQRGIENNIPFIMVGHISFPNITGDETPASLSHLLTQDLLREKLGYQGIIITDALNMGAITHQWNSAEAAVAAIKAGADILLMPDDFQTAYKGVLKAVQDQVISEDRIDDSLRRIIRTKQLLRE